MISSDRFEVTTAASFSFAVSSLQFSFCRDFFLLWINRNSECPCTCGKQATGPGTDRRSICIADLRQKTEIRTALKFLNPLA